MQYAPQYPSGAPMYMMPAAPGYQPMVAAQAPMAVAAPAAQYGMMVPAAHPAALMRAPQPQAEVLIPKNMAEGAHYFDIVGLKKVEHLNLQAPTLNHWRETSAKHPGVMRVHFNPDGNTHEVNVSVRGMQVKNGTFKLACKHQA